MYPAWIIFIFIIFNMYFLWGKRPVKAKMPAVCGNPAVALGAGFLVFPSTYGSGCLEENVLGRALSLLPFSWGCCALPQACSSRDDFSGL